MVFEKAGLNYLLDFRKLREILFSFVQIKNNMIVLKICFDHEPNGIPLPYNPKEIIIIKSLLFL